MQTKTESRPHFNHWSKLFSLNRRPECFVNEQWVRTATRIFDIFQSFPDAHTSKIYIYGSGNYNSSPGDIDLVIIGLENEKVASLLNHIKSQSDLKGQHGKPHESYSKTSGYPGVILKSSWGKMNVDWNILPQDKSIFSHAKSLDISIGACYFELNQIKSALNKSVIISPYEHAILALDSKKLSTIGHAETLFKKDVSVLFRIIKLLAKNPLYSLEADDIDRDIHAAIRKLFSIQSEHNINLFEESECIKPNRLYHEILFLWSSGYAAKSIALLKEYDLLDKVFPSLSKLNEDDFDLVYFLILSLAKRQDAFEIQPIENCSALLYGAVHWHSLLPKLKSVHSTLDDTDQIERFFHDQYPDTNCMWYREYKQSDFFYNLATNIDNIRKTQEVYIQHQHLNTSSTVENVPADAPSNDEHGMSYPLLEQTQVCDSSPETKVLKEAHLVEDYLIEFPTLPSCARAESTPTPTSLNRVRFFSLNQTASVEVKTKTLNPPMVVSLPSAALLSMPEDNLLSKLRRTPGESKKVKKQAYRERVKQRTKPEIIDVEQQNILMPSTESSTSSLEEITPITPVTTSTKIHIPWKKINSVQEKIQHAKLNEELNSSFQEQYTKIQNDFNDCNMFDVLFLSEEPNLETFPERFKTGYVFVCKDKILPRSHENLDIYYYNQETLELRVLIQNFINNSRFEGFLGTPEILQVPGEYMKTIFSICKHSYINPKYKIVENLSSEMISNLETILKSKDKKLSEETIINLKTHLAKIYCIRGSVNYRMNNFTNEKRCEEDFDRSLEIAPWLPDAYVGYWALYRISMLQNIYTLNSSWSGDYNDIFKRYALNKESAEDYQKKVMKIDFKHPDIAIGKAEMEDLKLQYENAQKKFSWRDTMLSHLEAGKKHAQKKEWLLAIKSYHQVTQMNQEQPYKQTVAKLCSAAHDEIFELCNKLIDKSKYRNQPNGVLDTDEFFDIFYATLIYAKHNLPADKKSVIDAIISPIHVMWGNIYKLQGDHEAAKIKYEFAAKMYHESMKYLKASECFDLINELILLKLDDRIKIAARGYLRNNQYTKAVTFYSLVNQLSSTSQEERTINHNIIAAIRTNNVNVLKHIITMTSGTMFSSSNSLVASSPAQPARNTYGVLG